VVGGLKTGINDMVETDMKLAVVFIRKQKAGLF
jgi:uncharacterized membrane protein YqjE